MFSLDTGTRTDYPFGVSSTDTSGRLMFVELPCVEHDFTERPNRHLRRKINKIRRTYINDRQIDAALSVDANPWLGFIEPSTYKSRTHKRPGHHRPRSRFKANKLHIHEYGCMRLLKIRN